MAKLLITLDPACPERLPQALSQVTGSEIVALEREGRTLYAACRRAGLTTALIGMVHLLDHPLPSGENAALTLEGEDRNPAAARASRTFTRHLTPAGLHVDGTWRARCEEWQARLKAAQSGERLLGEYPDAQGYVGYNAEGKRAFELDARRYLKAVQRHLGWKGTVHWNPGGIAVSGEMTAHLAPDGADTGVFVEVSACGLWTPRQASPSGVGIMWRVEPLAGQDRWAPTYRNRWASWVLPAAQLAQDLRAALTPEHVDAQVA
ncbi:hypothetical protein [Deinococcus sp.]|uniref:hypothetical protein n=1 Tax=Deinococcus sp. TaxID=47478 RepID=UPI00391DFD2E